MRTNIEIDGELMAEAMVVLGAKSEREAVEASLRTALRLRRQEGLRSLRGIGWEGDLDDMRTSKYIPLDG